MRKVLFISPHFPPDTSAGTHRARLLAPHLREFGWTPVVLTAEASGYESRLDAGLLSMVPASVDVRRVAIWSAEWTRRLGIGDLGLRSLVPMFRAARTLLAKERFDAVLITIYPSYTATLGPRLKRRFGVPFVLDYQDPWVGSWGQLVGGAADGSPDLRSRVTRRIAEFLEPRTIAHADAITAVSEGTFQAVIERNPNLATVPCTTIPLGGEPSDYDFLAQNPRPNPYFDPADGNFHLCYVGTLLPLGFETLRAVFRGMATLKRERPDLYARLRVRFFGTSNQTNVDAAPRAVPIAAEYGVESHVSETPWRVDYLDALTIQTQASAILMLGSTEHHYTASKLYPGLLAKRPILALYHAMSSVSDILGRIGAPPTIRLIRYDDVRRAEAFSADVAAHLAGLIEHPTYSDSAVNMDGMESYSARTLAGQLASVLDQVSGADSTKHSSCE